MIFKVGDILVAKNDFYMGFCASNTEDQKNFPLFLIKDKKYIINDIYRNQISIESEYDFNHKFDCDSEVYVYFYNTTEIRKLKLDAIQSRV